MAKRSGSTKTRARRSSQAKATSNGRVRHNDAKLTPLVLKARSQGKTWSEIGEKLGITPGKAQFLQMVNDVKPKDKIHATTDKALGKLIVKARDKDLLSWGQIAARTGESEGKCKRLYAESGGQHKPRAMNVASARAAEGETKPKARRKGAARRKGGSAKVSGGAKRRTARRNRSRPSAAA